MEASALKVEYADYIFPRYPSGKGSWVSKLPRWDINPLPMNIETFGEVISVNGGWYHYRIFQNSVWGHELQKRMLSFEKNAAGRYAAEGRSVYFELYDDALMWIIKFEGTVKSLSNNK